MKGSYESGLLLVTDRKVEINVCALYCLGLYPQIRQLSGIKSKAAISLSFNLHCKAIPALFFIPDCLPIWGHCLVLCVKHILQKNEIKIKHPTHFLCSNLKIKQARWFKIGWIYEQIMTEKWIVAYTILWSYWFCDMLFTLWILIWIQYGLCLIK